MTPLPYSPAPALTAPTRRALVCLLCLAACFAPACASAQLQQQTPAPNAPHRRHAPKPSPAVAPAPVPDPTPVAPPQPEQPKWPVNDPPAAPDVSFNSQGLHIVAQNSSLTAILDQVSTETGAKVEGLNNDERVFGDYGPGQARDVLAELLNGANYNVLIVGDVAQGLPLHVVLSPRHGGGAPQANPRQQSQDQDEDYQPPEPEEPPQVFQPPPQRAEPMNHPMTPQERMEMMQERQREMQQQQQQQPQNPQ